MWLCWTEVRWTLETQLTEKRTMWGEVKSVVECLCTLHWCLAIYVFVVLVSDDSYSVQRKALCIFNSCNSLKFSMAEKQLRFSTCLPFFFFPQLSPPAALFYCSLFLFLYLFSVGWEGSWLAGLVFLTSGFLFFTNWFWNFHYISKLSFFFLLLGNYQHLVIVLPAYFLFSNIQ